MKMSAQLVSAVVGAIVSVMLETVPGLKEKWSAWEWKSMTMFVLSLGVPVGIVTLSCSLGVELPVVTECGQAGFVDAIILGVTYFLGNQGTFLAISHRLSNAQKRKPNLWSKEYEYAGRAEFDDKVPFPKTGFHAEGESE